MRVHRYMAKRRCYWNGRLIKPEDGAIPIDVDHEGTPPHHLYSTDGGPETECPETSIYYGQEMRRIARPDPEYFTESEAAAARGLRPLGAPEDPRVPGQPMQPDPRMPEELEPTLPDTRPEAGPSVTPEREPKWRGKKKASKKAASKKKASRRRSGEVTNE